MAIIIYNPKTFEGKPSQPISFLFEGNKYELEVNSLAKFSDIAGREVLKRYGFLEEVKPEDLAEVQKRMENKSHICEHCGAEFTKAKALKMHLLGKHKLSKESEEALKGIKDAIVKETEKKIENKYVDDMPDGKGSDGVEIYGRGIEEDIPTMTKKRSTF